MNEVITQTEEQTLPPATNIVAKATSAMQPVLVESNEFRREADRKRNEAITKIGGINEDIVTRETEIAGLVNRRNDLMLVVDACDKVLTTIPAPTTQT